MRDPRELIVETWERLMGPDPGGLRLSFAFRVMVAVTLTVVVLIGANHWTSMPISAIGLGFMVAQFSVAAVRDPTLRGQIITTLVMPLPALVAIAAASLLAQNPVMRDVGLLAVIFVAVLMRAFGSRGVALGLLGFIAYYIGLALHPRPGLLFYNVPAAAIATATVLLVRFVLLPERSERTLLRILRALRARTARLIGVLMQIAATGEADRRGRDAIRRHKTALRDTALLAEDQINSLGAATPAAVSTDLGMCVFELEIAVERLALAMLEADLSPKRNPGLAARLGVLEGQLRGEEPDEIATAVNNGGQPAIARAIAGVARAITALPMSLPVEIGAGGGKPTASRDVAAEGPWQKTPGGAWWRTPAWRQAVQVVVAVALAIWLGRLVSAHNWYWSVLAAFIVFLGTSSRAATLTKAAQRVLGTLLGAVAGIAIARAVPGGHATILTLALVSDALAFYAFQVAYTVMIFWITVMIALLYSLLGRFHPELLVIRLDETLIGAAAGAGVALLLLPTRTSGILRTAGRDFAAKIRAAVEAAFHSVGGAEDEAPLIAARAVDRSLQRLLQSSGALSRGWTMAAPERILRLVHAATACTFWTRELAARSRFDSTAVQTSVTARYFQALSADLGNLISALDTGERFTPQSETEDTAEGNAEIVTTLFRLRRSLWQFARALAAVTRRL